MSTSIFTHDTDPIRPRELVCVRSSRGVGRGHRLSWAMDPLRALGRVVALPEGTWEELSGLARGDNWDGTGACVTTGVQFLNWCLAHPEHDYSTVGRLSP